MAAASSGYTSHLLVNPLSHKRYSDATLCFHIPVVATANFAKVTPLLHRHGDYFVFIGLITVQQTVQWRSCATVSRNYENGKRQHAAAFNALRANA